MLWLLFIRLFGFVLGCGGSTTQVISPETGQVTDVKIGGSVGERIPDIEITLIDGSTVQTADLIANGQPTFLFFFATW